jgi:hypothetical protein
MIDQYGNFWEVACDCCSSGETEVPARVAPGETDLVRLLEKQGWRIGLKHECPDCAEAHTSVAAESARGIIDVVDNWQ